MKLDFKHFKKTKEDEHSVTLRHPRGHEIRIAKKALNKDMQTELGAVPLWEGGEVSSRSGKHRDPTGNVIDDINPGESEYYAKERPTPEKPTAKPVHSEGVMNSMRHAFGYAEGGIAETQDAANFYNTNVGQPSAPVVAPEVQMPSNPAIEMPVQAPVSNVPAQASALEQGVQDSRQGLMGTAKAEGQLGKAEQEIAHGQAQVQVNMDDVYRSKSAEIMQNIKQVADEYHAGKIDPNQYWSNRSTPGKISTAIGLILGGMSAGVTGGENPALKFLNSEIDRNIEGQKANMDIKKNALAGLQQQFGNLNDATSMYKAMSAGIFATKLMEEASKSKDPLAMGRAQAAIGQLELTHGKDLQAVTQRQALLQGMQHGIVEPSKAILAIVPENRQKDAFEEIKHAEDQARGLTDLAKTMDEVEKLQSYGNRTLNPVQSASMIKALNTKIAGHVKEIFGKTSDTELEILKDNEIGLNDNHATAKRKKQIILDLASKEQSHPVLDAYGIKLPKQIAPLTKR